NACKEADACPYRDLPCPAALVLVESWRNKAPQIPQDPREPNDEAADENELEVEECLAERAQVLQSQPSLDCRPKENALDDVIDEETGADRCNYDARKSADDAAS